MNRHLASFEAPELTFDKIGSFSKSKGGVVFLTCSDVPESVDVPALRCNAVFAPAAGL